MAGRGCAAVRATDKDSDTFKVEPKDSKRIRDMVSDYIVMVSNAVVTELRGGGESERSAW